VTKQEFTTELRKRLSGIPQKEMDERIGFYSEMIDDRMEEGVSEEDAVSVLGSVDTVATQIIADIPLAKIAGERIKPKRRLTAWEVVLLALSSPIWLSLGISAFAVMLSVYAVLWSVVISLWSVFLSVAACAFAGLVAGGIFTFSVNAFTGIAVIGVGIACIGLAIFMFFGCKAVTKGIVVLTGKIAVGIKKCFVKTEVA
jgi:uncharacterized membrane protein